MEGPCRGQSRGLHGQRRQMLAYPHLPSSPARGPGPTLVWSGISGSAGTEGGCRGQIQVSLQMAVAGAVPILL